jgi:hypothetical protein
MLKRQWDICKIRRGGVAKKKEEVNQQRRRGSLGTFVSKQIGRLVKPTLSNSSTGNKYTHVKEDSNRPQSPSSTILSSTQSEDLQTTSTDHLLDNNEQSSRSHSFSETAREADNKTSHKSAAIRSKSFSITATLRNRRGLQSRTHHPLHDDHIHTVYSGEEGELDIDSQQTQQQQQQTRSKSILSTMSRNSKKRPLSPSGSNEDGIEQGNVSEAANNEDAGTDSTPVTNVGAGNKEDRVVVKELPSWRAECILYNRSQQSGNSGGSSIDSLAIKEQDWWNITVAEESDDDDSDSDEEGQGDMTYRNNESYDRLPLCATEPTYYSDSSASSDQSTGSNSKKQTGARSKRSKKSARSRKMKTVTKKTFTNVGLSIWHTSRAEWRDYTTNGATPMSADSSLTTTDMTKANQSSDTSDAHQTNPREEDPLTPIQYKDLVKGLTVVSRQYELPKTMNLADLIGVYCDIWDCEHD